MLIEQIQEDKELQEQESDSEKEEPVKHGGLFSSSLGQSADISKKFGLSGSKNEQMVDAEEVMRTAKELWTK